MQVISYLRVSSKGQLDDGGPDRQREAIARFCAAHELTLAKEFLEAISGTKDSFDRPTLEKALDYCAEQTIAAIVIERLDRLARDLLIQEILIKTISERGLKIFDASGLGLVDVVTSDADPGRLAMRQMAGVFSQYEKSMMVRRLRMGRERKVARDGWGHGPRPYGVNDEVEAATLEFLLALADSKPRPTYRAMAKSLNDMSDTPTTRHGEPWKASSVWAVLKAAKRRKKED